MKYYKEIKDNIIIGLYKSTNLTLIEITETEYNSILSIIHSKPEDTEKIIYKLNATNLEYEAYDRPVEPVIEPEATVKDYQAALTELGVNVSEES